MEQGINQPAKLASCMGVGLPEPLIIDSQQAIYLFINTFLRIIE